MITSKERTGSKQHRAKGERAAQGGRQSVRGAAREVGVPDRGGGCGWGVGVKLRAVLNE